MEQVKLSDVADPKSLKDTVNQLIGYVEDTKAEVGDLALVLDNINSGTGVSLK